MSIMAQITLAASSSGYIDLFIRDVSKADLIVETISESDVPTIYLQDGDGPLTSNIPWPYVQQIPHCVGVNAHGTDADATNVVFWENGGTPFTMSTRLSNRQTVSIGIRRDLGSDWLSILIPTVTSDTQVNIRGVLH